MHLVRFGDGDRSGIGHREGDRIHEIEPPARSDRPPIVAAATADDPRETGASHAVEDVSILAPIERPGKLVCLGLNYADHAAEGGRDVPDEPLLFAKATSAVIGPDDPIRYPSAVAQLDYEAELAMVIGTRSRRIDPAEAVDHLAGYTALNDVTARDVQYGASQFFRGKSFDTFAPLGPGLVTTDELDPADLRIGTRVNGETRQDATTAQMIFGVPEILESVSSVMTLFPGDVIATGTPPGVGVHRDPPRLLEVGDEVVVDVEGIGALRNPVAADEPSSP